MPKNLRAPTKLPFDQGEYRGLTLPVYEVTALADLERAIHKPILGLVASVKVTTPAEIDKLLVTPIQDFLVEPGWATYREGFELWLGKPVLDRIMTSGPAPSLADFEPLLDRTIKHVATGSIDWRNSPVPQGIVLDDLPLTCLINLQRVLHQIFPVVIKEGWHLRGLLVNDQGLSALPQSTGDLRDLLVLEVSQNGLIDLPARIDTLKNLRVLRASGNHLRHLPDNINRLLQLEEIEVEENDLRDLPDTIGDLPSLRVLHVGGNRLTRLPESLGRLGHLEVLTVEENDLVEFPASIMNLRDLRELVIDRRAALASEEHSRWMKELHDSNDCQVVVDGELFDGRAAEQLQNVTSYEKGADEADEEDADEEDGDEDDDVVNYDEEDDQ